MLFLMYNSNWCIKTIHFFEQNFGHYLVLSYGYSLRDIEFFMNFFFQIVKQEAVTKHLLYPQSISFIGKLHCSQSRYPKIRE